MEIVDFPHNQAAIDREGGYEAGALPPWLRRAEAMVFVLVTIIAVVAMARLAGMVLAMPVLLNDTEEEVLMAAVRFHEGKPLYGPITAENISTVYFPFFYVVYAGWASLFGTGIVASRAYSIAVLIATCCTTFVFVRKLSGAWPFALAASAWWLGMPALVSNVNLCISVDTLLTLLVLLGVACLTTGDRRSHLLLASLCFSLAAFTKQNMIPLAALPSFVAVLYRRDLGTIAMTLIFPVLFVSGALVINVFSEGWFFRWAFGSLVSHPYRTAEWADVLRNEILRPTAIAWLMAAGAIVAMPTGRRWGATVVGPLLAIAFLGAIGYAGSLKVGGGPNHLMGYYVCFPSVAVAWMAATPADKLARRYAGTCCLVLLSGQLYSPSALAGGDGQIEYAKRIVEFVRDVDGEVLYPSRPYLCHVQAGKRENFGQNLLHALVYGRCTQYLTDDGLPEPIRSAIVYKRYKKIILELPTLGRCPLLSLVQRHYEQEGVIEACPGPSTIGRMKIVFKRN